MEARMVPALDGVVSSGLAESVPSGLLGSVLEPPEPPELDPPGKVVLSTLAAASLNFSRVRSGLLGLSHCQKCESSIVSIGSTYGLITPTIPFWQCWPVAQ